MGDFCVDPNSYLEGQAVQHLDRGKILYGILSKQMVKLVFFDPYKKTLTEPSV